MNTSLTERMLGMLLETLGSNTPMPLHEPSMTELEFATVRECLESGWVSSAGPFIDRFEDALAHKLNVKHAVAVVNGTAALHAALLVAGVRRNDEVLIPTLTFVATANSVTYCGAVPHLVDSDPNTLGMSPGKLAEHLERVGEDTGDGCRNRETGRMIRAVVPMHTFGHPVDMEQLQKVAVRHQIVVVEDAAESLGSTRQGRHMGGFGELGVLSFNGNKIITTGGGGAVVTDDAELAKRMRHLTTTAKQPHPWAYEHDVIGFNYRMPSLNAALGCAQLERLDTFVSQKRALADRYREAFEDVEGIRFVEEPPGTRSNYWLNAVELDEALEHEREPLLERLNGEGYLCRPAWVPMHQLPMYAHSPRMDLSVAEGLYRRLINLPSSPALMEAV